MTKTIKKSKKCPACNKVYKSTLAVCPDDRTMLLTPSLFLPSQNPYDVLQRWVEGPYEIVSWQCRKCGEEDTRNFVGRCKNDWDQIVPVTERIKPDEPPLIKEKYKFVSLAEKKKLTESYNGTDLNSDKQVSIEILHPHLGWDEKTVNRFYKGCLDGMKLEHPHIQKIIDVDFLERNKTSGIHDIVYSIAEPLLGKNLDSIIKEKGRLSPPHVISIFSQVLDGLDFAHSKGIFHANLTLNSIYVNQICKNENTCNVTLVGFGIAERLFRDLEWDGPQSATKTVSVYGEIFGLAPELIHGKRPSEISDIYSIGCALYECLSGRPPFMESTPVLTLIAHLNDEPKPFPEKLEIPPKLEDAVLKCLSKNPEDRFESAKQLNDELKNSLI